MTIPNGPHSTITRAEYDAIDRLNLSRLKLVGKSLAHFKAWIDKDRACLRKGRAVHMAVFEPERLWDEVAIWRKRRQGKAWEAFDAANEGKEQLSGEEFKQALATAAAVRSHSRAAHYLAGGTPESTLLWNYRGLDCKTRLDFMGDAATVELKTTRDASEEEFIKQSYSLGYHVQAAWQTDARHLTTGEIAPFVIIAVEPEPPHCVVVYPVPERLIAIGRATYHAWLDRLAYAQSTDRFPGYVDPDAEVELSLPAWATQETR